MQAGSSNVVRRRHLYTVAALAMAMALPAVASGHLERPSYWPDPGADNASGEPTGGEVPKARSLGSAVTGQGPGKVRVVCQNSSLSLAKDSIKQASNKGFRLRPSQPKKKLSDSKAQKLLDINKALADMCKYKAVQAAIDDSSNNDRVVVMPGRYTEPDSREAPVNDPKCNPSMLQQDQSGASVPSYEYQAKCSNDQNLIYVQGRKVKGEPLAEPDPDRHGIPEQELGKCVRCNLQLEGSGARPEDVLLDAGKSYSNAKKPGSRPGSGSDTSAEDCLAAADGPDNPCYAKHVVLRTDRSDGFVGRNFLMRGAKEHGFYTEESDGVLLDKVKFFWNADYGHLSFTSDHSVVKNCDGYGSGDAVVYPGAAPQTGEFRDEEFYPEERFNTVIKKCDLHGSAMGYSGSMGNSVRVTKNNFYGNANGLTTDTLSAPGHPGFPADGMKVDNNLFYSNNFNVYADDSPVVPLVPQAVGTGIMWPGMNDGEFSNNKVFDNWQHGTFLIGIPDAIAGEAEGNVDSNNHCEPNPTFSTSCANQYHDNEMGVVPDGFKAHPQLTKFGNESGLVADGNARGAASPYEEGQLPNGVDFWWDESPSSKNNCWFDNTGYDGTRDSLTANPPINPAGPGMSVPGFLPEDCATAVGNPAGYGPKFVLLLGCFAEYETGNAGDGTCPWFDDQSQPGTQAFREEQADERRHLRELGDSPEAKNIEEYFSDVSGEDYFGPGD
ncbi:MAG: right-handed parallel beta-helix repeat-containing protein [Actinomycetota bacterium]|nr:right-handed parallel beta-helix repeat-containing protein [Actinomycetota bacterium]